MNQFSFRFLGDENRGSSQGFSPLKVAPIHVFLGGGPGEEKNTWEYVQQCGITELFSRS